MKVPFNKPHLSGRELRYISDAVGRRAHLSGDGFYTNRCAQWLAQRLDCPKTLLVSSGTHALELAFMLLNIGPGDEVLLPSFTFPSTANAVVLRGAKPVFVDIRPDTLNIDERELEPLLTRRTKAVVVVHYAGVPCQMDVIQRVARQARIALVEDAAQALGSQFCGKAAGSFGLESAFSFHETKNWHCGEGGALAINSLRLIERAEIIRQKGTNRSAYNRGEVSRYSWVDIGSSYVPSELQAAYLWAQLERFEHILARRKRLYQRYAAALEPQEGRGRLRLPRIPADCVSNYHSFYVLFESVRARNRALDMCSRCGINAVTHYYPLHLSKMGKQYGCRAGSLPVTESVHERLLRLPLYNDMTRNAQDAVIRTMNAL